MAGTKTSVLTIELIIIVHYTFDLVWLCSMECVPQCANALGHADIAWALFMYGCKDVHNLVAYLEVDTLQLCS